MSAAYNEKQGKTVAIIYDRLNYLTLGTIIALAKNYADKIYIVNATRSSYLIYRHVAGRRDHQCFR